MSRLQYLRVFITYPETPVFKASGTFISQMIGKLRKRLKNEKLETPAPPNVWRKTKEDDVLNWIENYSKN